MSAFRTAAGLMEIAAVHFRDSANVLRDAATVRGRNAANALKALFSAFSASISPEGGVTGYANSGGSPDITTPPAYCTVEGGVAPISYLWTRTDGGPDPWTINNPTGAIADFTATSAGAGASAEFICTCTDSIGAVAVAGPILALAVNLGGPL